MPPCACTSHSQNLQSLRQSVFVVSVHIGVFHCKDGVAGMLDVVFVSAAALPFCASLSTADHAAAVLAPAAAAVAAVEAIKLCFD